MLVTNALRNELHAELAEALQADIEAIRNEVEALQIDIASKLTVTADEFLQDYLDDEEFDCWLTCEEGRPQVLIGIGRGDVAASFDLDLDDCMDDYPDGLRSPEQLEDVIGKIAVIGKMISRLQEVQSRMQDQADHYQGA